MLTHRLDNTLEFAIATQDTFWKAGRGAPTSRIITFGLRFATDRVWRTRTCCRFDSTRLEVSSGSAKRPSSWPRLQLQAGV